MSDLQNRLHEILRDSVGEILARAVLASTVKTSGLELNTPRAVDVDRFMARLGISLRVHIRDDATQAECLNRVRTALVVATKAIEKPSTVMVAIRNELDILGARKAGQDLCQAAGFPASMQIKVATVISELARNIARYAGGGEIVVSIKNSDPMKVEIIARDEGPGIHNVEEILHGKYVSKTGMGRGLLGVKALMDDLQIHSTVGKGTTVITTKKNR